MKINIKAKKSAFTFIEILFITILLSAGLFFIANSIRHAKEVNYKVIQSVIANQLATEWVEIVYQLRNTNFMKYETQSINDKRVINSCRLAHDFDECYKSLVDFHQLNYNSFSTNFSYINEDDKMLLQTWYYYITNDGWINSLHNCKYDDDDAERQENCSKIAQNMYAICLNNSSWSPCTSWHEAGNDESKYWQFYRYIEWFGNYDMASNETWWTLISQSSFPAYNDAQEYRFCSRVYWKWMQWWEVEICATMTNFTE